MTSTSSAASREVILFRLNRLAAASGLPTSASAARPHVEGHLATRKPVPNDRRQVVIALTPRGKEIFQALHPVVKQLNERLLSALSDEEPRMLEVIISKLERHVGSWMDDIELPKADRRHGLHNPAAG